MAAAVDFDAGDIDAGDVCATERGAPVAARVDHASFDFAATARILKERDELQHCAPSAAAAHLALKMIRDILSTRKKSRVAQLRGKVWGTLPAQIRKAVLQRAGIDAACWESPIASFDDGEKAAINAAAEYYKRAFEWVIHAI